MATLKDESVNLFLKGPTSGSGSAGMNLYIGGGFPTSECMLPLLIYASDLTDNCPTLWELWDYANWENANNLWNCTGAPIFAGGFNFYLKGSMIGSSGSNINMYIERPTTTYFSMYLQGPGQPTSGNINFYQYGHQSFGNSFTMIMPSIVYTNNLPMYIRGW